MRNFVEQILRIDKVLGFHVETENVASQVWVLNRSLLECSSMDGLGDLAPGRLGREGSVEA